MATAADLPECRMDGGPMAMARVLVTYIADAGTVRQALKDEFGIRVPAMRTIRDLRARHLASLKKPPERPFKLHEGYYPADAAERAQVASKRFLEAIQRERDLSFVRAKKAGALNSPFLTYPPLVDMRFDKEVEQAWLQNGELR